MALSMGMRKKLVTEIREVAERMAASKIPQDKMYFFSAIYGMLQHIFNFEYEPNLVFMHQVIRQTFDTINAKVATSTQQVGISSSMPVKLFERLQDDLIRLAEAVEKEEDTFLILEDIAVVGYSSTGNGLYLYTKGLLKI